MASVAATSPPRPRRFAPLRQEPGTQSDAPSLQGIVFDVDGTLWYVSEPDLMSLGSKMSI